MNETLFLSEVAWLQSFTSLMKWRILWITIPQTGWHFLVGSRFYKGVCGCARARKLNFFGYHIPFHDPAFFLNISLVSSPPFFFQVECKFQKLTKNYFPFGKQIEWHRPWCSALGNFPGRYMELVSGALVAGRGWEWRATLPCCTEGKKSMYSFQSFPLNRFHHPLHCIPSY